MNRAQSSRLSEMPMRVVDSNRTSMVYTTPKRLYCGHRASGAGMPRNSSIGGFGGSEKLKDVRPLHDKAFVQQCVRQLSEFLSENGFLGSVSTKMLQSPSTKEFLKMFEFIYSQLDNTFQLPTSKVEEEVPRLLKDMGYPFAISKSSMYSVGAPHTWPLVLGALIWLIDTVKIYWCMSREELLFSDFSDDMNIDDGQMNIEDGPEYNKMFLDYTVETYGKYLQGADTFEDEDEVHFHKLSKNSLKRIQKMELQADLKKLQSFRSSMEALKSSMEAKALEVTDEQEAAGHQLESLKQEQERLQVVLKNQKFTPADVERINREKNELQQTISSLSKSLEEAEQHMWNEEIAVIKAKEKAELKLTEYHKLARKLKLIPASAENACGHDYEIRANLEIGPSTMVQYKTQVMVRLRDLIGNVEEEASQLTNQKLSVEESIEQVNCNLLDKSNDLKQLRENIRKLDQQVEQDMEEVARDEQKWAEELESLENHRKLLEKNVNIGHDKAVRELKAAQQQYHLVLQETNEERRSVANHLTSAISIAAEHLDMVELNDKVKRALSKATEEDTAELRRLQDMSKAFIAKAQSL
uniref:Kinetochore protein NDC80 n=1 Tax=Gadus morhua TaxID=8049 RepID=A0A8C5B0J9_GADMO